MHIAKLLLLCLNLYLVTGECMGKSTSQVRRDKRNWTYFEPLVEDQWFPYDLHPQEAWCAFYCGTQNISWPSSEQIMAHRIEMNAVPSKSKTETLLFLRERVRAEFIPDDIGSHLIPLKKFRRGDDYFIVRYLCAGWKIQIIDGYCLHFLVCPPFVRQAQEEATDYVLRVAKCFFSIPEPYRHSELCVFLQPRKSKSRSFGGGLGDIMPTTGLVQPWYREMGWCSDGNKVVYFMTKKKTFITRERLLRAGLSIEPNPLLTTERHERKFPRVWWESDGPLGPWRYIVFVPIALIAVVAIRMSPRIVRRRYNSG